MLQRFSALGLLLVVLIAGLAGGRRLASGQVVRFRFDITNPSGTQVDSVQVGELFDLNVYIQDIRPVTVGSRGVFSGFLDVFYDTSFVSPLGEVIFGDAYRATPNPVIQLVPGAIENVGNTESNLGLGGPLGPDEFLLFRAPFRADAATGGGTTLLHGGAADDPPRTDVQIFTDPVNPVPLADIIYGRDVLVITPGLACDFNSDQACDVADMNLLFEQGDLVAGVATSAPTEHFDLIDDNVLGKSDIEAWLAQAASLNGYTSAYRSGDTNQLGSMSPETRRVDIIDFNRLAVEFNPFGDGDPTNGPFWDEGNIDGDDDIDIVDFNTLALNFSPLGYGTASLVPEPSALALGLGGIFLAAAGTARRRKQRPVLLATPMHHGSSRVASDVGPVVRRENRP